MVQAARKRHAAGNSKVFSAAKQTGVHDHQCTQGSGWAVSLACSVLASGVGIYCAQAAQASQSRGAILGMPLEAFVSSYLRGPCGGPLEQWLWQHGGWPNAYVAPLAGGGPSRGLVAAFDLRPGDRVMFVPEHLHIKLPKTWARRATIQGESEKMERARDRAHALIALALRLQEEESLLDVSKWSSYLQAITRPGNNLAVNSPMWPKEATELAKLLVPVYMRVVSESLVQVDSEAELVQTGSDDTNLADDGVKFRSMLRHVLSRMHGQIVEEGDVYIVPMIDFINMATPPNRANSRVIPSKGGMVVEAVESIGVGEEVTITYGDFPNAHLLVAYGFSFQRNRMSSQLFRVNPHGDSSSGGGVIGDGPCDGLLQELAADGLLQLHEALAQINDDGWVCLRGVEVLNEHGRPSPWSQSDLLVGGRAPTLGEACRGRAAALNPKVNLLGHAMHNASPSDSSFYSSSVLKQLRSVAKDEIQGLLRCAGDTEHVVA